MPNPCSSVFWTSNSVVFSDVYKTYDKAIIMCDSTCACTIYIAYNAMYWKHMTTEAQVNTANRFDPDFRCMRRLVLLVFALFVCCFTVFSIFQNFWHQKSHFLWNSVYFHFLPKFCGYFCFPYRGKLFQERGGRHTGGLPRAWQKMMQWLRRTPVPELKQDIVWNAHLLSCSWKPPRYGGRSDITFLKPNWSIVCGGLCLIQKDWFQYLAFVFLFHSKQPWRNQRSR